MQVCGKLPQPKLISRRRVGDTLALLHQLADRRIRDHLKVAITGNASAHYPVGDAGLKLFGNGPSLAANRPQLLQPLQFFLDARQLSAFIDHRRRLFVLREAPLGSGRQQSLYSLLMTDLGLRQLPHVCPLRDLTVKVEATLLELDKFGGQRPRAARRSDRSVARTCVSRAAQKQRAVRLRNSWLLPPSSNAGAVDHLPWIRSSQCSADRHFGHHPVRAFQHAPQQPVGTPGKSRWTTFLDAIPLPCAFPIATEPFVQPCRRLTVAHPIAMDVCSEPQEMIAHGQMQQRHRRAPAATVERRCVCKYRCAMRSHVRHLETHGSFEERARKTGFKRRELVPIAEGAQRRAQLSFVANWQRSCRFVTHAGNARSFPLCSLEIIIMAAAEAYAGFRVGDDS